MGNDYLHRRTGRRSEAYYRFFSINAGGPDEPPPGKITEITDRARGAARAAVAAYLVISTFVIPDIAPADIVELRTGQATAFSQPLARAKTAPSAYEINVTFFHEILPGDRARGFQPDRAPGPRRAAPTAYQVNETFSHEILPGDRARGFQTDLARGPARTAPSAYLVNTTFFHEILPGDRARGHITDIARGPQRTATTAYWIEPRNGILFEADPVPLELQKQVFPDHARGRIVEKGQAYYRFFSIKAGGADVALPVPVELQVQLLPDKAPGRPRAANDAYWHRNDFVKPDVVTVEAVELQKQIFPDTAPGRARAANTAYWHRNEFVKPDVAPPVDVVELRSQEISEPLRAHRPEANAAFYRFTSARGGLRDVPVGEQVYPDETGQHRRLRAQVQEAYYRNFIAGGGQVDVPVGDQDYPSVARGRVRTANAAYWLENIFVRPDVVPPDVVELRSQEISEPLRAHRPSANAAFFRFTAAKGGVIDVPVGDQLLPDKAPGRLRAANETYWQRNEFVKLDVIPPDVVEIRPQLYPDRAPGAPRAAASAYIVTPDIVPVPDVIPPVKKGIYIPTIRRRRR